MYTGKKIREMLDKMSDEYLEKVMFLPWYHIDDVDEELKYMDLSFLEPLDEEQRQRADKLKRDGFSDEEKTDILGHALSRYEESDSCEDVSAFIRDEIEQYVLHGGRGHATQSDGGVVVFNKSEAEQ